MAGLQDFFTDNSGTYGAFVQGEQRGRDINKEQALSDYTALERPLKLQQMDLSNQTAQGGLGSVLAKSQLDQETLPGQIEAKKAKYLQDMDDDKLKAFGNYGQKVGMMGAALDRVPPPARLAAFQQMAQEAGIGMDRAQDFLNGDPADLPKRLQEMGRDMILSAADSVKARALQQDKDAGDLRLQELRNKGMIEATGMRTDAAAKLAQDKAAAKEQAVKVEQRIVQLNSVPPEQRTPQQQSELQSLTDYALSLRAAGANQTGAEIVRGSEVTTPSGRIPEAVQRITKPTPAQMQPQGTEVVGQSGGKPVYGIKGRPETYYTK